MEYRLPVIKHLDLCSGIGGFSLGLNWAGGFETVAFGEVDRFASAILRDRFPGIPNLEDINALARKEVTAPEHNILTAGFPCQTVSTAGLRLGKDDDRWLWDALQQILEHSRPRWVLFENVVGLITLGLDGILADLEGLGYTARAAVVPACAVNAPHRRSRVFIIGNHPEVADADGQQWWERESEGRAQPGGVFSRHLGGQSGTCAPAGRWADSRIVTFRHGERYRAPMGIRLLAHGLPYRASRIRALGNAVVPQVIAEIGRAIRIADDEDMAKRAARLGGFEFEGVQVCGEAE